MSDEAQKREKKERKGWQRVERIEQHEQGARLPRSYDTAIPWREKFYFAAPLRNSLHKTVGDIRAGAATWNEAIHIKNTQQRQN